jgi:hypothetical protein
MVYEDGQKRKMEITAELPKSLVKCISSLLANAQVEINSIV